MLVKFTQSLLIDQRRKGLKLVLDKETLGWGKVKEQPDIRLLEVSQWAAMMAVALRAIE